MLDWQTYDDQEELPALVEPSPPPLRFPWRRLVLLLAMLLCLAGAALYYRSVQQEKARTRDLTAFVLKEERARLAGLRESLSALVTPDAPSKWKSAYQKTFVDPDEARPVEVRVGAIQWQDDAALAEVWLGERVEWRSYQFANGGWRRSPLVAAAWGEVQTLEVEASALAVDITYQEKDEAFAQALAASLPSLLAEVEPWLRSELQHTILIQPHEFQPALTLNAGEQATLVLNSPYLVPPHEMLSQESLVRFTLVYELIGQMLLPPPNSSFLPGAEHFREAARLVIALDWALTPAEQQAVQARWPEALENHWPSPFLASSNQSHRLPDAFRPTAISASLLGTVHALHQRHGTAALLTTVDRLRAAASWDALFLDTMGSYTAEVENAAREVMLPGQFQATYPILPLDPALQTPFHAKVILLPDAREGQVWVQVAGYPEHILIDTRQATFTTPEGVTLNPACATLYAGWEVEGDWRDPERELRATRLTLPEMTPPFILRPDLPPADTIAYLLRTPAQPASSPLQLIALGADGAQHTLLSRPALEVLPFKSPAEQGQPLLLRFQPARCDQAWIFLYDPDDGTVQQWLMAPEFDGAHGLVLGVWEPRTSEVILLYVAGSAARLDSASTAAYARLTSELHLMVPRTAALPPETMYHLLHITGDGRWVLPLWQALPTAAPPPYASGPTTIATLDPATSQLSDFIRLAEGGRYRATLIGRAETFYSLWPLATRVPAPDPPIIGRIDWATGQPQVLLQGDTGQRFIMVEGGATGDSLLVLAGTEEEGQISLTRLLRLSQTPPEATILVDITEGNLGFGVTPCRDGSVLYQVMQSNAEGVIYRLQPDGQSELVMPTDGTLQPVACW